MRHDKRRHLVWGLGAMLGAALVFAHTETTEAQGPGFRFERPNATFGLQVGYAVPRAGSDIFDFTREQLTIGKSDFNAVYYGGALGIRVAEHFDLALNLGYERSASRSEFRDWVGDDDLPIEQDTRFTRVPLTLGVKAYPWERGRRISQFAWIPRRWNPYLGAGGGITWYRFEQIGEFVDFETFDIFLDEFESGGGAPTAYVSAGVDVSIGSRWLATGEGRYSWASASMDRDFVDFEDIDLAGFRLTAGFSVRF